MFDVNNGKAEINGRKGSYDKNGITNPSVKYGRNAAENYFSYAVKPLTDITINPAPILDLGVSPDAAEKNAEKLEKFIKENDIYLNSLPPLEFEYRYMPNIHKRGEIDKNALLGAAYEEMGGRTEINVREMDETLSPNPNFTTAPIDINKDGKIDISEYSTTMLAADMYSKSDNPTPADIDGTINQKGMNKVLEYTQKSNAQAAAKLYSGLYNQYQLGNAAKNFNPNA